MTGRAGNLFPRFLRTHLRPCLKERGYSESGLTYRKTDGPATAHLVFLRYTSAHAGHIDLRMSLTLDPYAAELGAVLSEDLSRRIYGSVAAAPWRWPAEEAGWPALASSMVGSVTAGAEWIEALCRLPRLAAYLEAQRRFAPETDTELTQIKRAMASSGIATLYESAGYLSPRAGTIRPDKVKALSYCYELLEAWKDAADAWRDYMTTLRDPAGREPQVMATAQARLTVLEERSRTV